MHYLELKKKLYNPLGVKMEEISCTSQNMIKLVKDIVRYVKQTPYTTKTEILLLNRQGKQLKRLVDCTLQLPFYKL
jgi:ribosome-associated toxin RatA of RatAB toxin-antitoxin module